MINQLLVSIIIPTYNRADLLPETLNSIIAQTYTNWECIVVDDGSTDNTANIVQQYAEKHSKIKLFSHPNHENRGAGASRNLGIINATGDFIAFLDADDFFLPNRFDAERELFKNVTVDGVYNAIGVHYYSELARKNFMEKFQTGHEDNTYLTTVRKRTKPEKLFESLWNINGQHSGYFSLDGFTIRRTALQKLDALFNENLRLHQDTEFLNRVAYYCALYPGNTETAVALRGVHEENRITVANPKKTANNSYKLYHAAYRWARVNNLPAHVQNFFYNKYLFFKFETLPTIKRLGWYAKTALTYPGFFQSKDPYIKNIHRHLSGNRYIKRIQSIFLPAI